METAAPVMADASGAASRRIESIDLVRGIVMVLMVLDHCRDYFGDPRINPTNLATTTPALFFTRWITHFCAPTFALLAGTGAALWSARHTPGERTYYLITRGLWLIVLEQTWVNVFVFNVPHFLLGIVLWALGWSMIVLAGLAYLPRPLIGAIAVATIAGHNLLDGITSVPGVPSLVWGFLHRPGMQVLPGGIPILLGYPLIPWFAVMALGYAIAPIFSRPSAQRRSILLVMGLGSIAAFVILRGLNVYGDPQPWTTQSRPGFTALSFLNVTKQPPSFLYLLVTLGTAFVALAALDRGMGRLGELLRLIGRVPLYFFLMQWPVAHALAIPFTLARGYPIDWLFRFPSFEPPPGYGNRLDVVYLAWLVTLAVLYALCVLYDRRRRRRRASPPNASPAPSAESRTLVDA